jgi:hypothetical protein
MFALDENPFASVRQPSQLTHISPTTVYHPLTESLGFIARHLRWVLHALSNAQKTRQVDLSRQLLRMVEAQCDRAWHDIVTLDESWFYPSTDHELIWLPRGETVPEPERYPVLSQELILTVVWNLRRFHLIDVLAKGRKFNTAYSAIEILSPLSKCRSTGAKGDKRQLIIHPDNARTLPNRQLNSLTKTG